jgi:hypothetical protein
LFLHAIIYKSSIKGSETDEILIIGRQAFNHPRSSVDPVVDVAIIVIDT